MRNNKFKTVLKAIGQTKYSICPTLVHRKTHGKRW